VKRPTYFVTTPKSEPTRASKMTSQSAGGRARIRRPHQETENPATLQVPGCRRGSGLSNNRIGLEVACLLARLTGRHLELYDIPTVTAPGREGPPLIVTDLFDLPIPYSLCSEPSRDIPVLAWPPLPNVILVPPDTTVDDERLRAFSNGRVRAIQLGPLCHTCAPAQVRVATKCILSMYSYTFLPLRVGHLADIAGGVRPKRAYREMAGDLARKLGEFDAVHLRFGDFLTWNEGAPRTASITPDEVLANLETRFERRSRLVVFTDSPEHPVVDAVRAFYPETVVFELWFEEVARAWGSDGLLSHVEVGLVSQIVAVHSRRFVGTMCSTFSAIIQRDRGAREFLFAYNQFPAVFDLRACRLVEDSPEAAFSWQRLGRRGHLDRSYYSWFREWPEARP
jgi:hypothetical protein